MTELHNLTKVIATLGPASQNRLEEMIVAGVNVFRLNFSHKSSKENRDQLTALVQSIRAAGDHTGRAVAIMGDLQGPKFRIGELKDHQAVMMTPGARLKFSVGAELGTAEHLYTKNAAVIQGLSVGHRVLLDDGCLEFKVLERIDADNIICEVVVGGKLGEKKGINVPDIIVSSKLSEKDKEDAKFAVEQGLDYICLSFVQTADDVHELRHFMRDNASAIKETNPSNIQKHTSWAHNLPLIISKIEKPQAVDNIATILEATDGIMVARGDLGVELSLERVPAVQKMLIEACNAIQKPVITATQMLQTMIDNPVPTRAEVSDVANAVFDGSDAVMLSAESAVGAYPIQSVQTMSRIIQEAEKDLQRSVQRQRNAVFLEIQSVLSHTTSTSAFHETISQVVVSASRKSRCSAIIVVSYSGLMAMRISKHKPDVPVIALTPNKVAYRRMAMLGAVFPVLFEVALTDSVDTVLSHVEDVILKHKLLTRGVPVLFCAGTTDHPGLTNTIKLYQFGDCK
jgi:pyruvate kinase